MQYLRVSELLCADVLVLSILKNISLKFISLLKDAAQGETRESISFPVYSRERTMCVCVCLSPTVMSICRFGMYINKSTLARSHEIRLFISPRSFGSRDDEESTRRKFNYRNGRSRNLSQKPSMIDLVIRECRAMLSKIFPVNEMFSLTAGWVVIEIGTCVGRNRWRQQLMNRGERPDWLLQTTLGNKSSFDWADKLCYWVNGSFFLSFSSLQLMSVPKSFTPTQSLQLTERQREKEKERRHGTNQQGTKNSQIACCSLSLFLSLWIWILSLSLFSFYSRVVWHWEAQYNRRRRRQQQTTGDSYWSKNDDQQFLVNPSNHVEIVRKWNSSKTTFSSSLP